MSISTVVHDWLDKALPRDCLLCGKTAAGGTLCEPCTAALPQLPEARCPICAQPTPLAEVCGHCIKHPPHFDATQAVWPYEFPLDQLIHSLKYARRLASADFFGTALAALRIDEMPQLIVPVPLAGARLVERGFNQAVEIARPLAHKLGVPLELDGILRVRDTTPQAALPWKERRGNIRHAFECRRDLSGLRIAVVDDVMTSGATLNEFARALKTHGAARVENLVLARALRQ